MPFAVVGSERNVVIDGKAVPGRRTKWGMINGRSFPLFVSLPPESALTATTYTVQNPAHCEFPAFRQFLLQTHTQDLIETTALIHYESFRTKQLLALKESTGGSRSGLGGNAR